MQSGNDANKGLAWAAGNSELLGEGLKKMYALSNLEVISTDSGITTRCPLVISDVNALITLPPTTTTVTLDPETIIWRDGAIAAGGTFLPNSITIADALIRAIKAQSFNSKIIYLLPVLGGNVITAIMPLRDALHVGIANNLGFTNADFSQATGLQGDPTERGGKALDSKIKTQQLGVSNNGGIGFWDNGTSTTGVDNHNMMGASDFVTTQVSLSRTSSGYFFNYGAGISYLATTTTGDYYGQRASSSDRQLFINGVNVQSNFGPDGSAGFGINIYIDSINFSGHQSGGYHGRCACCYMTDGTLTDVEIAALHNILSTKLIIPTGR